MAKKEPVTVEGAAVEVSPEQAADFARLAGMAEAERIPGAAPEPEPEPVRMSAGESLAGVFNIAGMLAGMAGMPSVAKIWTPDAARGLSEKTLPVLQKYTWGRRIIEFIETGAGVEELALMVYAVPLVMNTVAAARADLAKPEPEPEQANAND